MSRRRGVVDRRAVAHVEQHELDTAERLARLGLDVVFRAPNTEPSSDASVNGIGAEFKSPISPNRSTVIRRITSKRHEQGPRFVLDMSRSPIGFADARLIAMALVTRYREDGISSILVIKQMPDGEVLSGLVGEEVSEWRM